MKYRPQRGGYADSSAGGKRMASKQLLFSLTKKDFEFEFFCTGGPGGQHKNAKKNGVRVRHPASGAVAEHRDGRDQFLNKRLAFEKLAHLPVFEKWLKIEVSRRLGTAVDVEALAMAEVDRQMRPENLRIEEY